MKYLIYIFYSYFIIAGGFRNFSSELLLQSESRNFDVSQLEFMFLNIGEYTIFILALLLIIFPLKKYLHLFFFLCLFSMNFYFQNFINYERYIVLIDFVPLIFFLFIHYQKKQESLQKFKIILIRIIAIGFLTAVAGKITKGWISPTESVIHAYVYFISNLLSEPNIFQKLFFKIDNLAIYKFLDYGVLIFQAVALLIFIKPVYFKKYAILAVFFHIGIMLLLNISFFFPYIIIYTLILMPDLKVETIRLKEHRINIILVSIILIAFAFNKFDVLFISRYLNYFIYINLSNAYTILTCVLFFFLIYRNQNNLSKV